MKKIVLALSIAAALAGCASDVKLDDAPVVDKSTSSATQGAGGAGATQSAVTSVDLNAQNQGTMGPPAGTPRIVYFDFDSYSVRGQDQATVEANARYLKGNSARKAVVEGHTDERGGREYNLALGQKRAEAVRRSLTLLGVADSQLEAVSFGKEKPAAVGSDEESMAKNRRAEISYR
ncbi:peptidoglycan-associated lipoprotein Pal [Variovorax sp. HJSM1_2]|uniref:peptidoglycan-associated lipoprotein Pal n=1 Tax=Variovorax sp. HJSM1_2 TaxID=3366263 RepID=UPI003BDD0DF8